MGFAERNGFIQEKTIQIENIDQKLRNRLCNVIKDSFNHYFFSDEVLAIVVDRLGHRVEPMNYSNWAIIERTMQEVNKNNPWYMPYETIELILEAKKTNCKDCLYKVNGYCERCDYTLWLKNTTQRINVILEQEKSAYRLIGDCFIDIVNEVELQALSDAINSPYESVRKHINKAVSLYADRENPDYENSIKESISAVESMCCIITGAQGSKATLGNTIDKLKDSGVIIHPAMETAFSKLYGYTSDVNGIRHGGIDFTNAPSEDAKYMLISCSAFVNYLIEKQSKLQK